MLRLALIAVSLVAAAGPALGQARFTSSVPAIRMTAAGSLPPGPGQQLDDNCADKVVTPRGRAARAVRAGGWHVTGEERLGRLTAISFVGELIPGMSGICLFNGGNVGLFDGARLVAIAFAPGDEGGSVRRVARTTIPGRLRLWSDELSPPLADMIVRGDGAALVPIIAEERWCGGVATPNVYGLSIRAARRRLLARGWRPAPPPAADIAAVTAGPDFDFRRAGISEVEVCSGTGFGLCLFNYRHAGGARLEVQTAGDESVVGDQRVTCAAPRRRRR